MTEGYARRLYLLLETKYLKEKELFGSHGYLTDEYSVSPKEKCIPFAIQNGVTFCSFFDRPTIA